MVPLTVTVSTAGGLLGRSPIVMFVAFTPIQVAGAYPAADAVRVAGPLSESQASASNLARPVESVSSMHGVGSEDAPTRTEALETTAFVSSSITWTYRCPSILPSPTPPPGINRGAGGPLTPPHPTTRNATRNVKERTLRMALSSTHPAQKRRTISRTGGSPGE